MAERLKESPAGSLLVNGINKTISHTEYLTMSSGFPVKNSKSHHVSFYICTPT